MRSPLTELYQKVNALAEQIHAMPEDERNFLLDLLLPENESAAKPKKTRKKRAGKSARASSLQQQIAGAGNKPKTNHEPEGILTEEEAQLVIGAIPLQMLPEDVK